MKTSYLTLLVLAPARPRSPPMSMCTPETRRGVYLHHVEHFVTQHVRPVNGTTRTGIPRVRLSNGLSERNAKELTCSSCSCSLSSRIRIELEGRAEIEAADIEDVLDRRIAEVTS